MNNYQDTYTLETLQDYEIDMPEEKAHSDEFAEYIPKEMIEYARGRYSDDDLDDDVISYEE